MGWGGVGCYSHNVTYMPLLPGLLFTASTQPLAKCAPHPNCSPLTGRVLSLNWPSVPPHPICSPIMFLPTYRTPNCFPP